MTILRLKNPTNIYRIDAKKLGGERGYLTLEDLWIKSKFPRSNMPIHEVGRSGGEKKPEREKKEEKKGSNRKVGAGLKHHLGVRIYDAKLGARIYGAELPAKSPSRLRRAQDLGASNDGAEQCKLSARNDDACSTPEMMAPS